MFEYILLLLVILSGVASYFFCRHFANKILLTQSKLLDSYRKELLNFSITQKQNTEKLVELLNRLFITPKQEPNDIGKSDPNEIEFSEQTLLELPKDIKFEVEGGDSSIPPGYPQSN